MATFSSTDFKSSQIPASDYLPPSSGSGKNIDNSFTADGTPPGKVDDAKGVWTDFEFVLKKTLDVFVGGGGPAGWSDTSEGYGPFTGGSIDVPDLDSIWAFINPILKRLKLLSSAAWAAFDVAAEVVEGAASQFGIVYTSSKYKDNQQLSDADAEHILHNMTKFSFDTPREAYLKSISVRVGKNGKLYADHSWYDDALNLVGWLLSYFTDLGLALKLVFKSKNLIGTFKAVWKALQSLSLKGIMNFVKHLIQGFSKGGSLYEKIQNVGRVLKGKTPVSSKFSPIGKETLSTVGKEVGEVTKVATKASLDGIAKAVDTIPAAVKAELRSKITKVPLTTAKYGTQAFKIWLGKIGKVASFSSAACYGSLKYINESQNKGWTEREIRKNAIWQGYSAAIAFSVAGTLEKLLGAGFLVAYVVSEASEYGLFTALGGGGDGPIADSIHKVFSTGPYKQEPEVLPGDEEPVTQNTGGMIKGLNKRSKR